MRRSVVRHIGVAAMAMLSATAGPTGIGAQGPAPAACDDFLPPPQEVLGTRVGPRSCLMQESDAMLEGRALKRLDIGLDGTVDGYLAKTGDYKEYLSNSPDLVFPQTWGPREIFFAVAAYERDKGAGMTVVYPRDRNAWNGKAWVTAHGRGASFKEGQLKPWNRNVDPADPMAGLDKFDRLMVSKGYALVKTRRTSTEGLGEIKATLEDGTSVDFAAFNDTAHYIMDFAEVGKRAIAQRLGQAPSRTYLYGHSAGARIGHDINYAPGLNIGRNGKRFFDGILADDPAAGTWYPVVMKDGKDVLFTTDAERAAFVPQIDVAHQMYNNVWPPKHPAWMSSSYLENKRNNAKIARDKGLTKYRMYEVRGISHSGGENLPDSTRLALQNLDLSKLMDRFIDMLDAWVEKGAAPPPTHSDWAELGDLDRDGVIEHPALAFPEVACPLGVYFSYPNSTAGATSFAPFSGQGLEPLDGNKVFVDMNRNGVWDFRETPTEAWRRIGLLRKDEKLTREKYVNCIRLAAKRLQTEGFFTEKTSAWYADQAKTADLEPKSSTR